MGKLIEILPDNQDGFIFRGGVVALDLNNTDIVGRGKSIDLLGSPRDLERWWAVVKERYPAMGLSQATGTFTTELLAATKALRAAIHEVIRAVVGHENINAVEFATINNALAMAHLALETAQDGTPRQVYSLEVGGSEILFQLALSASYLLTQADKSRLHKCGNPRCVLYFYDNTKSATRRWCSTECQNRVKSSENYRRRKEDVLT